VIIADFTNQHTSHKLIGCCRTAGTL